MAECMETNQKISLMVAKWPKDTHQQ